jgi:hypothetical protein
MSDGLPFADKARIDESKVVDYLLNPAKSRGKAGFFLHFGFLPERWSEMAQALASHGRTGVVSAIVESEHGSRYSVDGPLNTPAGRQPTVRTVWIVEHGAEYPRLITAHPL